MVYLMEKVETIIALKTNQSYYPMLVKYRHSTCEDMIEIIFFQAKLIKYWQNSALLQRMSFAIH